MSNYAIMKYTKPHSLPLFLLLIGTSACLGQRESQNHTAQQDAPPIPIEFLVGTYDVIGRYPDSEQLYTGTVAITLSDTEPASVAVTRMIDGVSIQGKGEITTATGDAIAVLRVVFQEADRVMEATYLIDSDLDNYARLTGYVYVQAGRTQIPGIESLFHNHYRNR